MFDTRQRYILKTALQLFRSYGLRVVTMDEIAQRAGMSKKTLYSYFREKNELIDNLYKSITAIVEHRLNKIQQQPNAVFRYIQVLELAMAGGDYITSHVMDDLKKFHEGTFKKLQLFIDKKFMPAITQCIEDGNNQGYFQPLFNSKLMAMVCLSELDFLNETANKKIPALSTAAIRHQLTLHLLYGIATNAGKKQADKYFNNHSS